MRLFDLHCDTPYRMYRERLSIDDSRLDCPLDGLCAFERAVQVAAIWSDSRKSAEENYDEFFRIADNFLEQIEKNSDRCLLLDNDVSISSFFDSAEPSCELAAPTDKKVGYILAVEDASLLCGKLDRLEKLYSYGIRMITPSWGKRHVDNSSVGGAHDTREPLTAFGKELVGECRKLGIAVDLSHMSECAFWQAAEILSGTPLLATHSNSKSVTNVGRNITDIQFSAIAKSRGICGMNLYPPFCGKNDSDNPFEPIAKHILHFRDKFGISSLCLGGDRDGIEHIDGYTPLSALPRLYATLSEHGLCDDELERIFYRNAFEYFREMNFAK